MVGDIYDETVNLPELPKGWEYVELRFWNPGVGNLSRWDARLYRARTDTYVDFKGLSLGHAIRRCIECIEKLEKSEDLFNGQKIHG